MAIKNVVTRGFAFAGTVALVATRGYAIGAASTVVTARITVRGRGRVMRTVKKRGG